MKLRVRGDSIRLRVTQSEVARLIAGEVVEEHTHIGGAQFIYALGSFTPDSSASDRAGADIKVQFEGAPDRGLVRVSVPLPQMQHWGESNTVGIDTQVDTLAVLIEKDFACLDPRDGIEDSDTFPNPKAR